MQGLSVVLSTHPEVGEVVEEASEDRPAILAMGGGVEDMAMPHLVHDLARHDVSMGIHVSRTEFVRLSVAATLLDLSVPTIRIWIDRGLLDDVDDSSPRRVTLKSVLEVRPLVRELRTLGRDRNLLEAVLARLEDERTLSDRDLLRSLDDMRTGKLADITPASGA